MRILRHRTMRTHDARWFEDEAINLGRFAVFRQPRPR